MLQKSRPPTPLTRATEPSTPRACTLHTITMNTNQTDFFPVAARLALELECLLLSCKDTAAVSKWWDSAHEALQQFRGASQALERAQDDAAPVAWITKEQLEQIEEWTADAWVYWRESGHVAEPDEVPLFLHPSLPAAQGLSDDEITQVWLDHGGSLNGNNFRSFARAILSRAATAGAGAENGSTAAQSQARSQSTLVPNGAATVAEPSEACRECNGAGKVDVTHSPLRDGYTETVRECCGTCGGTGKSEVSDGEREIREIWTTQAERENAQRTRMLDRFANRAATPATADFDLIAPNDAQAAQQQAEPSEKLEAPAQVGSTVFRTGVEKRLVVEAAQRLYQFRHNPTEEEKRIADASASIARLRAHLAEKESRDD